MSKIALEGNASGTGVFTLASPATNTDRTLTLPDEAGTVLTSVSAVAASQITSALNATGSAPIYACRAWVNFNGTTNTGGNCDIRASGNVSTVADNGTGDYTVNFATAMPDENYCVASTSVNNTGTGGTAGLHVFQKYSAGGTQTTTQFQMMNKLIRADTSSIQDGANLFAAFFR